MSSIDITRQRLHSILVNQEESFFKGTMRPRANSEPLSPRPCRLNRVRFDLPDIVVDDCSDNDEMCVDNSKPEEINPELANTDEGAFFVYKSPPRQRSNTVPSNMWSKQSKFRSSNRPPTPPPKDDISRDTFTKYPSWEKMQFSHHHLSNVDESHDEAVDKKSSRPNTESSVRGRTSDDRRVNIGRTSDERSQKTMKQKVTTDSPSASPKRPVQKLSNGHVATKSKDSVRTTV